MCRAFVMRLLGITRLGDAEDREHVLQQRFGAQSYLVRPQVANRVRHYGVTVLRVAVAARHGVGSLDERRRDNRHRLYTFVLEDGPVRHTGGTTAPSIANTGNYDVAMPEHLLLHVISDRP